MHQYSNASCAHATLAFAEGPMQEDPVRHQTYWRDCGPCLKARHGQHGCNTTSLLQSLKSLVTQAQQRPSFDLCHGLSELVAEEKTRRQTGQGKDEYESLWDGHAPGRGAKDGNEDDSWHGTFEDYLEQIQKQGCWATYLECFALSAALYRTILILNDWGEVWHFVQEGHDDAICLFYQEHIGHYEFLDGPVEAELRHWSVQHAGAKGARAAGGGGRSQPSPKSLRLSDFGTPNSKISARSPTAKANLPVRIFVQAIQILAALKLCILQMQISAAQHF